MTSQQIALILAGALAGGLVNGLTGFGTGITALGIWLYAIPPSAAAALALACAFVSQLQTLPMIWRHIRWGLVLPLLVPGVLGVPVGTLFLTRIEPRLFKLGVGIFLVVYSGYVLARRGQISSAWGGKIADAAVGFGGGVLGGLAGLPGVLPIVWTDIRGWTKEQRRGVVQAFNIAVLSFGLVSYAMTGLLSHDVLVDAAVALPGAIVGAWFGAFIYRRLADRGYQSVVMLLLLFSGLALIWTSR